MTIEAYKQNLIVALHISHKDSVLDYGCGKGDFIQIIISSKQLPKSLYAVDASEEMINHIRQRFSHEIATRLIIPKVCDKPEQLIGLKFDKIMCHNVLECIEDKKDFINGLYNLLADNGTLLLSHYDFDSAIYNSGYKDLTRNLIHHFSDTKQEWQEHTDGQIGRKIPGLIKKSLFKKANVRTERIVETEFKSDSYGHLMASMMCEIGKNIFSSEELALWLKDLENKNQSGEYYFAIDLVVAIIKRND